MDLVEAFIVAVVLIQLIAVIMMVFGDCEWSYRTEEIWPRYPECNQPADPGPIHPSGHASLLDPRFDPFQSKNFSLFDPNRFPDLPHRWWDHPDFDAPSWEPLPTKDVAVFVPNREGERSPILDAERVDLTPGRYGLGYLRESFVDYLERIQTLPDTLPENRDALVDVGWPITIDPFLQDVLDSDRFSLGTSFACRFVDNASGELRAGTTHETVLHALRTMPARRRISHWPTYPEGAHEFVAGLVARLDTVGLSGAKAAYPLFLAAFLENT